MLRIIALMEGSGLQYRGKLQLAGNDIFCSKPHNDRSKWMIDHSRTA